MSNAPIKKAMKWPVFLLLPAFLTISVRSISQVNLHVNNISLEKVFKQIRQQTGYTFIYEEEIVQNSMITVNVSDVSLAEALKSIFKGQPFTYQVLDKNVVVKALPPSDKSKDPPNGKIMVTGTVQDEQSNPLQGATIREKNGPILAITDTKGEFSGFVMNKKAILQISYIGHETRELLTANMGSPALIILPATVVSLKEVSINKGYYRENKLTSVGNATTITAKEIENQPVNNPLLALAGRVPGMTVTQTSGVPGAAINVQIRGKNTLAYGSNDPLYVVDGVIYTPNLDILGDNVAAVILGGGNPLSFINSTDIESISILKDGDATAIYGSRGANGVILITTKKGKAGKMQADVRVESGFSFLARSLKLMNTQQYLAMRKEAFANDTLTPSPGIDLDLDGTWDQKSYTNWQKAIANGNGTGAAYKTAHISLTGGDQHTQYLVSGNFRRENSLYASNKNDQNGGLLLNLNTGSDNKRFRFQFSGNYMSDVNLQPNYDPYGAILNPPDAPAFLKPDGSPNWSGYTTNYPTLPGSDNLYNIFEARSKNLVADGMLSYQLTKGLEISANLGYNNIRQDERTTLSTLAINPAFLTSGFLSSATFANIINSTYNTSLQLNYHFTSGKNKLNATAGGEYHSGSETEEIIEGDGYILNSTLSSLAAAGSIVKTAADELHFKTASLYARLNYVFDDKYLLNVTARRDGSSRFGPGRQFGNFGSAGAGWVFSNEPFLKNRFHFLSLGKLRGSYGLLGNQPSQSYQYLELYRYTVNNPYGGGVGLVPRTLPGADFAWEKDKKQELGLELGFLNNRIQTSISYFKNQTSNQLLDYPLPNIAGFLSVVANLPATVQNTGLEFTLNTINIRTARFQWSTNFNTSTTHNKLIRYDGLASSPFARNFTIGQPTNSLLVTHFLGVDPVTGIYQFSDGKGGKTFRPDLDYVTTNYVHINKNPRFYGGVGNNFTYKSWRLDVFIQIAKQIGQNYLLPPGNSPAGNYSPGGFTGNQPVELMNRWQKMGDHAAFQRYTTLNSGPVAEANLLAGASDLAYTDASFLRFKTISLSWEAPAGWMKKMQLSSWRIYANAQNLFTITSYKGPDPETQSITSLPPLKTIVFGLELSF